MPNSNVSLAGNRPIPVETAGYSARRKESARELMPFQRQGRHVCRQLADVQQLWTRHSYFLFNRNSTVRPGNPAGNFCGFDVAAIQSDLRLGPGFDFGRGTGLIRRLLARSAVESATARAVVEPNIFLRAFVSFRLVVTASILDRLRHNVPGVCAVSLAGREDDRSVCRTDDSHPGMASTGNVVGGGLNTWVRPNVFLLSCIA